MTSTNRDWSADDPYADRDLPEPPTWLPDAGHAVRAAMSASGRPDHDDVRGTGESTGEGAGSAAAEPPDTSGDQVDEPSLEKRSDSRADAQTESPFGADADERSDQWAFVPLGIMDPEAAGSGDDPGERHAAAASGPEMEPLYSYDEFVSAPEPEPDGPTIHGPGLPGQYRFEDDTRERPWALIALAGALAVLIAVIVVIFMNSGDGGNKPKAKPSSGAPLAPQAMPSGAVGARPVPADKLPALRPQSVAVGTFAGELQVTWDPPQTPEAVSGYFVVTQTVDGEVDERVLIEKNSELTAVFDNPKLCVVVTTVVGTPEGLQLARGDLVCPPAASPSTTSSHR